jgi:ribosomal protein L24
MSAGFRVADRVVITGGKYKGDYGVVMKLSSKMVVVRLDGVNGDVRVYQCHVEKSSAVRTLEKDDKSF